MAVKIDAACSTCNTPLLRKQSASMYFCGVKCKSEWQRTQKPVNEEWLRSAYIDQKMDCTQIGKLVGRDPKSVWNWLKDFGIETRRRGTTGNHVHSIGVPRILSDESRKNMSDRARAARLKDGRLPYMKDGKHWLHHEGARPATWKGGVSPERQAFYSSREWKDAVKSVWLRDGYACVRCESDLRHKRGECAIHHLESFANRALRGELSNLVLLCRPCHLWVHSKKNINKELLR